MSAAPRLNLATLNGFPNEIQDGKMETIAFIDASIEVIGIIENFGTLFSPVVNDMRGNVDQLLAFYERDKQNRRFIEDMILLDQDKLSHPWLLWLKRALELIERFFFYVLTDDDIIKQKSDNLKPMIQVLIRPIKPFIHLIHSFNKL